MRGLPHVLRISRLKMLKHVSAIASNPIASNAIDEHQASVQGACGCYPALQKVTKLDQQKRKKGHVPIIEPTCGGTSRRFDCAGDPHQKSQPFHGSDG